MTIPGASEGRSLSSNAPVEYSLSLMNALAAIMREHPGVAVIVWAELDANIRASVRIAPDEKALALLR